MSTDLWTQFRELSQKLSLQGINLVERREVGLLRFQSPDQLGKGEVNAFAGVIPNILDLFSGAQALAFVHLIFKGGLSALCVVSWRQENLGEIEVYIYMASSQKYLWALNDYLTQVVWTQFVQAIVASQPGLNAESFTRVNRGLAA